MSINLGINLDLVTFLIFAAVAVAGLVPMRLAGLRRVDGMWLSLVAALLRALRLQQATSSASRT